MIRKQHKRYSMPRKLFEQTRIDEENKLMQAYGLKNKREIWKADFAIEEMRNQAKSFITASGEKQQEFINRLISKGLVNATARIDDVLALKKEAIFERRLETIVFRKNLAKTAKGARQLIIHRHIRIDGKVVNIPSYPVSLEEESKITFAKKEKKKKEAPIEMPKETANE